MFQRLLARLRRRHAPPSQEELVEEERIQREAELERRRAEAMMAEQRGEIQRHGGSGWGSF
jgi:hypothetical protein